MPHSHGFLLTSPNELRSGTLKSKRLRGAYSAPGGWIQLLLTVVRQSGPLVRVLADQRFDVFRFLRAARVCGSARLQRCAAILSH